MVEGVGWDGVVGVREAVGGGGRGGMEVVGEGVLGGEMENKSCLWRIENVWVRWIRKLEDIMLYCTQRDLWIILITLGQASYKILIQQPFPCSLFA